MEEGSPVPQIKMYVQSEEVHVEVYVRYMIGTCLPDISRQYQTFSVRLIGKFGRTGYFERRRGERLCTPSEMVAIRNVLREIGLPELEFDGYLKQYNWSD